MDISVIVPVFNGGKKIGKCVDALKRQKTERTFEIIVVDDGSTDRSLHGVEGKGIRVFKQPNQGPGAARNLGVEKALGKIILFTDADCEPLEDWIDQMACPLDKPCTSGVKGSYLTRQKGLIARFVQLEYESKYERMKRDPSIDFVDTYAAGFIKEDFLKVGKYDARFPTPSVEDQEFSFRMWEKGYRMVFNPEAKVFHTHSDSLWNYMKKKFRIGFWKALVLKKHPQKVFRDSHTPQSLKLEMVLAMLLLLSLSLLPVMGASLSFALFPLAAFLITTSPFVLKLLGKDLPVALFSPFLLFARALSLSSGLIAGMYKFYVVDSRVGSGVIDDRENGLCEKEYMRSMSSQ
ncbi:MAG: glycosyltransferase [Thermodesulfobacteriota bacterium]|nr:glycosyltransferase [Thermodesulfobacteriota bacterium]